MKTALLRNAATRDDTVPTAPAESLVSRNPAPKSRQVPRWGADGPAPTGTLHRLHAVTDTEDPQGHLAGNDDYIPRRGPQRFSLRALGRTRPGRITLAAGLVIMLACAAAAGLALHQALFHDRRFVLATSADIEVTGNHHLTRADVLRPFAPDLQHNIFTLPLASRRAELESLPWVEHATLIRLLPNRLRIDLRERTPIAFVRQGTQIGLVDASGVLLDMPQQDAGDPHYSFPVLTGLSPTDSLSTRATRLQIYTDFLHQLDSTGHRLSGTISEVDVTDPEDLKALVSPVSADQAGYDVLVHFGDQDFLHRYQQFEQHLPTWRQQYPRLASADMRYDAQVVLEMQPGSSAPPVPLPDLAPTAASPPQPAAKLPAGVNVPPRPVIISHNTTAAAPVLPDTSPAPTAQSNSQFKNAQLSTQQQAALAAPPRPAAPPLPVISSAVKVAQSTARASKTPGLEGPALQLRHSTQATKAVSAPEGPPKPAILRVSTPATHTSSANERLFAQLAADHKAALSKAAAAKKIGAAAQ